MNIAGMGSWDFQVDHYYKLADLPSDQITLEELQTPAQKAKEFDALETAFDNRLSNQEKEKEKTLVLIAASGGGIQASGWTAQVLGGLQEELGSSVTKLLMNGTEGRR